MQSATAIGTEILSDGKIVVALNTDRGGQLMLLSADGKTVLTQSDLDGNIMDIDSDTEGYRIAVTHGDNVTIFTSEPDTDDEFTFNSAIIGSVKLSAPVKAVALADDGRFAALANKTVNIFDLHQSTPVYQRLFNFSYVTDIEIDATGDNFFLTSFDNQRLPSGKPVQSARIASYAIASGPQSSSNWVRFGREGRELANDIADTRLYRVEFGADGMLYTLGESAGTKSQFRWDGVNLGSNSPLRTIDHHNNLWNTGSAHVAYHARVVADSGEILAAQLTMGRLNNGKSNTFSVGKVKQSVFGDITADPSGRMMVTGEVYAHMANRAGNLTINGQPVSTYNGGDATLMVIENNFRNRSTWTTLDRSIDFKGFVTSVAIRHDKMVLLTDVKQGQSFTSDDAIIKHSEIGDTVHLSIIDMKQQYQPSGLEL